MPPTTHGGGPTAPVNSTPVLQGAMRIFAVVVPVTGAALVAVAFALGETDAMLAWGAGAAVITAFVVAEVRMKRVDADLLVLMFAVGVAATAPFTPATAVTALVSASLVVSLIIFTVVDRRLRSGLIAAMAAIIHSWSFLTANPGWNGVVGVGLLFVGCLAGWLLLDRISAQVRRQHASYRELFDRVPVGLYRTGLGGELLDVNPALADLLGLAPDDLIGRRAQEFFVDVDDFAALRAAIGDRPDPLTTDIKFRRPDGEIIWVRDQTRPVTDDEDQIICFEGELQDVTDQRRHLEELEALVKSKSELIGAVSHELRTPLTAVVGFLELLQSGEADEDGELLALAADQARDVAGIVDDLLTAARLENHELVVQEASLDLRDAVDGAVTSVVGAGRSGIEIDVPPGLTVWADGARVRQVVRNLVSNAIRYGNPPVTIRAAAAGNAVTLTVSDRGSEIPERVSTRMFDAFFSGSGDGSTRQPGSIGLGLAVSQRLARLMGGDLCYTRVDDETCFTLELRAERAQQLAETA